MNKLDIRLYKFKVIEGQEGTANEWLQFLKENAEEASQLLKAERAYLESYFTDVEDGTMYIYMFFAADNVDFSNETAGVSKNAIDVKHFEYMKQCIDLTQGALLKDLFHMNNLEDLYYS